MECCKEIKRELYLTTPNLHEDIMKVFDWDDVKFHTIKEFIKNRGKYLAFEGNNDEIRKISLMLVENNISFEVKSKK